MENSSALIIVDKYIDNLKILNLIYLMTNLCKNTKIYFKEENQDILSFLKNNSINGLKIINKIDEFNKEDFIFLSKYEFNNYKDIYLNIIDRLIILNFYNNGHCDIDYNLQKIKLLQKNHTSYISENEYLYFINKFDEKSYVKRCMDSTEIHSILLYNNNFYNEKELLNYLKKFINEEIHIHIYTLSKNSNLTLLNQVQNKYIHIEKNYFELTNPLRELLKYDLGVVIPSINCANKAFITSVIPQEIYTFMIANIPIAASNYSILSNLLLETNKGNSLDFKYNLRKQINLITDSYEDKCKIDFNTDNYMRIDNVIDTDYHITKISIIIPTMNRNEYLKRCVKYFNNLKKLDIYLIILDSSDENTSKKNSEFIKKIKKVEYYKFDKEKSPFEKIYEGLKYVKSKYCCICADDDFISEIGLIKSIKYLEENKDYITVKGNEFMFYDSDMGQIFPDGFQEKFKQLDKDDPMDRLVDLNENVITQLIYLTYRKNDLLKIIRYVPRNINWRFQEYLIYFMVAVSGKVDKINYIFNIRDYNLKSSNFINSTFSSTIDNGIFAENYKEFKKAFIEYINIEIGIENNLEKIIDKCFKMFMKNSLKIDSNVNYI